jgi:hypothetical protein
MIDFEKLLDSITLFRFRSFFGIGRPQSSASVEELLNREECNVEMLMDDEDIIQEFRNMNNKLVDLYLS